MTRDTKNKIFKTAILEGLSQRFEEEMETCTEDANCSSAHYRKMSDILGFTVSRPKKYSRIPKKAIVAIIVAAILLLTACTAYVFRNEIAGWIEQVYDGDIAKLSNVEENNGSMMIEENYSLGFVPDGYKLTKENSSPTCVEEIFNDDNGNRIIFRQRPLSAYDINVNAEGNDSIQINCGGNEIYFKDTKLGCTYIWKNEKYYFSITSSDEIGLDALEKMLDSISID